MNGSGGARVGGVGYGLGEVAQANDINRTTTSPVVAEIASWLLCLCEGGQIHKS